MEKKQGKIQVTVQTEERMRAITELSIAIRAVAEALNRSVQVIITDCMITTGGDRIGIMVDTAEEIDTTTVYMDGCNAKDTG